MTVAPQQIYTFRSSYTDIAYSKDDLRGLVAQVERLFCKSDIYTRALHRLQEHFGTASKSLRLLVNALGREAIRLTLKELISSATILTDPPSELRTPTSTPSAIASPTTHSGTVSVPTTQNSPAVSHPAKPITVSHCKQSSIGNRGVAIAVPDAPVLADEWSMATASAVAVVTKSQTPNLESSVDSQACGVSPLILAPKTPPARTKSSTFSPKPANETQPPSARETALHQIGQALQQARSRQAISIEQLHQRTCVPIHHIRALENRVWHHLPEDIYLRGFIRMLGDAVGLNGQELSQTLAEQVHSASPRRLAPSPLSRTTKAPTGHRSPHLNRSHLYLGYATLMAGATGGLAWMVSQPAPLSGQHQNANSQPTPKVHQQDKEASSFQVFAQRVWQHINAIATPETMPPESTAPATAPQ